MRKKKPSGVYRMCINGKMEDLCIDGDGWEQIDTFHKIEKYSRSHKFDIKYTTIPTEFKYRYQDVLSATSDRYEIVVCKLYSPNTNNIFFAPNYRVQIHDRKSKQIKSYAGTMAGFIFEKFDNMRGAQK